MTDAGTPIPLLSLRIGPALPVLSESWRLLAQKRLQLGRTEDWSARFNTPEPRK